MAWVRYNPHNYEVKPTNPRGGKQRIRQTVLPFKLERKDEVALYGGGETIERVYVKSTAQLYVFPFCIHLAAVL